MESKRCTKCNETKTVENFGFQKERNSYRSHCKACRSADAKKRRDKKRGYAIEEKYPIPPEGQKRCTKCKAVYPADNDHFKNDKSKGDGFNIWCKKCSSEYERSLYQRRIEKRRADNREYGRKNKASQKARSKKHYEENKEEISAKSKIYNQLPEVKRRKNKIRKVYVEKRKASDPNFRLSIVLRNRIYAALKKQFGKKAVKTIELLGCSVEEAREHIESLFTDGMSWDNYGNFSENYYEGWHIDHIRPCASFDLTNKEEQKKCFHYTNLQPLWAEDNILKGDDWGKD